MVNYDIIYRRYQPMKYSQFGRKFFMKMVDCIL
ncbi:unnamed protein product [Wuchereria bancrofti]|uniref:Uncharacterized protein n=1 Tax=Wuchereria bancrofti TaxID=6293 RepID=A0A3P7G2M6_WUCBA|nr:unnamed protein product [Wuchereria bancrofti]